MPSAWAWASPTRPGSFSPRFENHVKIPLLLALMTVLALGAPLGAVELPGDGFASGWKRSGPLETFGPAALYNVIDGGAELFLEMGFGELQVQKYAGSGTEMTVEAYRMESPAAALGIYLLKCSREIPLPGIAERHSGDRFQIALLKGNYFIFVNNFSGRAELLPAMSALARQVAAAIPAGEPVRELDVLPAAGQVPGSRRLLRGPYSLQSVFTLGEGDVLQLGGKTFAAAAEYREAEGQGYTLIIVPYDDAASAQAAFHNLRRHLDPYLQVRDAGEDFIVFKDFQDLFGRADLRGQRITIRVKMERRPAGRGQ
jgi:hypothetical protein